MSLGNEQLNNATLLKSIGSVAVSGSDNNESLTAAPTGTNIQFLQLQEIGMPSQIAISDICRRQEVNNNKEETTPQISYQTNSENGNGYTTVNSELLYKLSNTTYLPNCSDTSSSKDGSQGEDETKPCKKRNGNTNSPPDSGYWEKRRKNNESAKRSRDARRLKEEQIAEKVASLEQENIQLKTEAAILKHEIDKLKCMIYN